jgi:25S rRNA (uracil2634-N3)-methyltransferase
MGKNKRMRLAGNSNKRHKPAAKSLPKAPSSKAPSKSTAVPKKAHNQASQQAPTIPFTPSDRILLIGEGDLSFARSLVEAHGCAHVTATVLERDLEELSGKYPQVAENIAVLEEKGAKLAFHVDAAKMGVWDREGRCVGTGKGRKGGVDRVMFNFPHVGGKSTDVNRQVRYNQGELSICRSRCLGH